jgi:hypothetical protein
MKKIQNYLVENIWVWAGTGLVLLTLSGQTLKQALWITSFAILLHFIVTFLRKGDENE